MPLTLSQPSTDPRRDDTARHGNMDDMRAVLSMLEGRLSGRDAGAGHVPPQRLRDLASRLVATLEKGEGGATPAPKPAPAKADPAPKFAPASAVPVSPAAPPERRNLFSKPSPLAPPTPIAPARSVEEPRTAVPPDVVSPEIRRPAPVLRRADVDRLIAEAVTPQTMADEHPAVAAWALMGKAPKDQARILRALPRGQARNVHRAMRLLELAG